MRKVLLLIFITSCQFCNGQVQDFNSYRKGIMQNFSNFRKTILEDYAKFLDGVWTEFQVFRGEKRDETPKPVTVPKVEETPVAPEPTVVSEPTVKPKEEPGTTPKVEPTKPIKPITPTVAPVPTLNFSFYGIEMKAVKLSTHKVSSLDPSTLSYAWKKYQNTDIKGTKNSLELISKSSGLNDWFTFELVRKYVDALLKSDSSSDRILLQHFLLTNIGYDVRLGRTNKQLLLLVPFKQKMYEHNYLKIDGINYYVFFDNISPIVESSVGIYTCELPAEMYKGEHLNLIIAGHGLSLTMGENKTCTLSDGRLHLNGTINSGMMEMLRHYPQMDVPYYAESNILPSLHKDILNQLKPQLSGMTQRQAANALLHFVQYAFDFATDEEQHGYEKTYFIEENFYYPKNDCEDRSIFYAFLVHNLLDLDVHLIEFPGHECTAIHFTDSSIDGNGYIYKGKKYIICDPTYVGAKIGQCMPDYINVKPIIEKWY